jgi:NAD(P)H-dependent flavin oxidoreductase YrpB (nitropropane dioxygenase family)
MSKWYSIQLYRNVNNQTNTIKHNNYFTNSIGGLVLLAKAATKLTKPYLASGGIGDGKQLAACLALGADGVNMGTRFCATKECNWPQSFKQAMLDADERSTVLMFRTLHNTARVFKNKVAAEVERIQNEKGKDLQFSDVQHLVMGDRGRKAEQSGDKDGGIWTAGQVVGLINDIPTVQELMDRFMKEAEDTVKQRLNGMMIKNAKF